MSSARPSARELAESGEVEQALLVCEAQEDSSPAAGHCAAGSRRDLRLLAPALFAVALCVAAFACFGDLPAKHSVPAASPGATGVLGLASLDSLEKDGALFTATTVGAKGKEQTFMVPEPGKYMIVAAGAGGVYGGRGVTLTGVVRLDIAAVLNIQVGQTASASSCGGGGATVVTQDGVPLLVAGGGGRQDAEFGTAGGDAITREGNRILGSGGRDGRGGRSFPGEGGQGGAGWYEDNRGDPHGPVALQNGGKGGSMEVQSPDMERFGGFGGGGAEWYSCGGGGGYSGGAGAPAYGVSGGGGSFSAKQVTVVGRSKTNRKGGFARIMKVTGDFQPQPMPSREEEDKLAEPGATWVHAHASAAAMVAETQTQEPPKATHTDMGHCTADTLAERNKRVKAAPSLFCWSIMMPGGEEALMQDQLRKKTSVFGCNDFAVISRDLIYIGKDECGADINTWVNQMPTTLPKGGWGSTTSYLNVQVFVTAWKTLFASKRPFNQDFTVKADPDAVFLPDRVRLHIGNYTDQNVFFMNCQRWEGDKTGKLAGSLEIFTKAAVVQYSKNMATCSGLPSQNWGEDLFMQKCMTKLGVTPIVDFKLVSDQTCKAGAVSCSDQWRAAFHPYHEPSDYWDCFNLATGR